jgi:glycosyltransferase involved in cell wall biosynthesis
MRIPSQSPGVADTVDVSIVMPCLNEADCLPACIANAGEALALMRERLGLSGEILVADNGSTDGSQELARRLGARVVPVSERGYGAALAGGARAAAGRYILMGDADGSYDFRDGVAMVEQLVEGADLCMGSRFKGGIKPGAMPWKNRYIGNPVLTGILNILFRARIGDAHCGIRALTRRCFDDLRLTGRGMEFASEMVIKAALKGCRIAEVPATLSPDLRNRPPHLRPWRDGWRHLRYLLMLSPTWLFALPALLLAAMSLSIFAIAGMASLQVAASASPFGNYWVVLAGGMLSVAHLSFLLAIAGDIYGVREGYRRPGGWVDDVAGWMTLERMLIAGALCLLAGLAILGSVLAYWSAHKFEPILNVLPAVLGTTLVVIGAQNALGGFLLAILGGNEAKFLQDRTAKPDASTATSGDADATAKQPA